MVFSPLKIGFLPKVEGRENWGEEEEKILPAHYLW